MTLAVFLTAAAVLSVAAGGFRSPREAQAQTAPATQSEAPAAAADPSDKFTPEIPIPVVFTGEQDADDSLLARYIRAIYIYFIWVVGIVAVVMVMYGGIRWVAAAGNPGQIKEARDIIDNAVIGVLIALASVVLLNIINPKLTKLQLPGLTQIGKESACIKKDYTDINICRGSDWLPCGQTKERTYKDPSTGEKYNYICYGTFCKTQNNVESICMFIDAAAGYGTPTCVTSIPAQTYDDKCNVTVTSTIPVTSDKSAQTDRFLGAIQIGRGGLGTEYIGNYCAETAGVGSDIDTHITPNGFIVGKPKAQILSPVADATPGSPTSHPRLHGRGCPDWKQDLKMGDKLMP